MNSGRNTVEEHSTFTGTIINLEKLKIGLSQLVSPEFLADAHVEHYMDNLYNQVALYIKGFLWSKRIEKVSVKYPSDWWQAFKERWFPQWALDKWPVVYTEKTVDVKVVYPELHKRFTIPAQQSHLQLFTYDDWDVVECRGDKHQHKWIIYPDFRGEIVLAYCRKCRKELDQKQIQSMLNSI